MGDEPVLTPGRSERCDVLLRSAWFACRRAVGGRSGAGDRWFAAVRVAMGRLWPVSGVVLRRPMSRWARPETCSWPTPAMTDPAVHANGGLSGQVGIDRAGREFDFPTAIAVADDGTDMWPTATTRPDPGLHPQPEPSWPWGRRVRKPASSTSHRRRRGPTGDVRSPTAATTGSSGSPQPAPSSMSGTPTADISCRRRLRQRVCGATA